MPGRKRSPLVAKLIRDDSGKVVSAELVTVLLLVGIGILVGAVAVRNAMVSELGDGASSIGGMNQSYSADGISVGFDDQGASVSTTDPRHEGQP